VSWGCSAGTMFAAVTLAAVDLRLLLLRIESGLLADLPASTNQ